MGKKQPSAPDPAQQIAAQGAANREAITESARVTAVDQYGPQGSTTYQRRPDGTPYSQTVALTPQGQRIYDTSQNIAGTLTDKAQTLANRIPTGPMDLSGLNARLSSLGDSGAIRSFDPGGLPQMPGVGDFSGDAERTRQAAFGKAQSLLQPGQQLDRRRLEQQLSDRGIPLDSAAGQAELTRMEASQSEANARSAYDAVAAGGAEQSRLFGLSSSARNQLYNEGLSSAGFDNQAQAQRYNQALTGANFANDQRAAALQEALALRNQDFNEASALLQGAPVMGAPSFQNTPTWNMQPVDAAGIYQQDYANRMDAYNNQQKNLWGNLLNIGTGLIKR